MFLNKFWGWVGVPLATLMISFLWTESALAQAGGSGGAGRYDSSNRAQDIVVPKNSQLSQNQRRIPNRRRRAPAGQQAKPGASGSPAARAGAIDNSGNANIGAGGPGSALPAGQELVNIDFPEPTDIKDIIRAVAIWTGKNVILGKGVSGKVQMISPRKVTKEEAYQAFLSSLNVLNLTTVETGKVIKIMPIRNALKGNLQIFQGSSWAPRTDKMITQIVPLKYIDAKKLQTTLSRIVTTNSMVAYTPTNTLIISDTGYKVRRILAIIELLDVQGQQPQVVLVPIRYADAKTISQKVSEILRASTGKSKGSSGQKYKISVDERSNSVVIFGPPRTIADVKDLVRKFDFPIEDPANQAAIRVRFLNYADAKKLSSTLSSLASGRSNRNSTRRVAGNRSKTNRKSTPAKGGASSPTASTVADLGNNVKITADESSNALLITGSRAAYNALNNLIRKLDQRRAQVYVEVDIVDVSLNNDFQFETSIFAGQGRKDGTGTKVSYGWQGASGIAPIIAAQQSQSSTTDGSIAPETAAGAVGALGRDFTIGILSGAQVNVPGVGTVSPGGLIRLIKNDANSKILSSPHLLTSNNETAKIVVGQKIFYQTATQTALGAAGSVPKTEKEDVDLTLEIKPNISHTGDYLTLKIDLQANDGEIIAQGNQLVPDVNKRQTSQIVTVKSGQTAVISGLIKSTNSESYSKIPLLGDIPILGWLFRNSTVRRQINNLMFFITPYIVYGANDLAKIYKDKVLENQELMGEYFDDDEDSEFYRLMPKLADGEHVPSPYEDLELRNRERYLEEMRQDMGFSSAELKGVSSSSGGSGELPVLGNSDDGEYDEPVDDVGYGEDSVQEVPEPAPPPPAGGSEPTGSDPGAQPAEAGGVVPDNPPPIDLDQGGDIVE